MVCLGVMKPPMIFATCYKKLIARKDCMKHWIPGMCSHWRGITGDNIELKQFDDMLPFLVTNRIAFYY